MSWNLELPRLGARWGRGIRIPPIVFGLSLAAAPNPDAPAALRAPAAAVRAWRDDAFGVFIHWSPSTAFQGRYHGLEREKDLWGEWFMRRAGIPVEEYEARLKTWRPDEFNAAEWAELFREAGFRYLVYVAKHHDGFAMFDSDACGYNLVDFSGFPRDPFAELCREARRRGLKPGFYYSHGTDWHALQSGKARQPGPEADAYFRDLVYPQLRELGTKYGPQAVAWFDLGAPAPYARKCIELLRQLQPNIMVSSRVGGGFGDFATGGDQTLPPTRKPGVWETCMTLNWHWAWYPEDRQQKSPTDIIRLLARVRARGGNLLLNVGPDARGRIPLRETLVLKQVGAWLRINGAAIYGARPTPYADLPWGVCTRKPGVLYLHLFRFPSLDTLFLPGLSNTIARAYFLADPERRALSAQKVAGGWTLNLAAARPAAAVLSEADTVIAVEYAGELAVRATPVLDQDLANRFIPATAEPGGDFQLRHSRRAPFMERCCATLTVFTDDYAARFKSPAATVCWPFDNMVSNVFCVRLEYANRTAETIPATVTVGGQELAVELPPTVADSADPHWFKRRKAGWLTLSPGRNQTLVVTLRPPRPTPELKRPGNAAPAGKRRCARREDYVMLKAVILESACPPPYTSPYRSNP